MTEMTIHGRGGQGGVTLAKLIATAFFLRGRHVQAFGLYAAERSGAPVQAFVRIDDREITTHNQVRRPDHVIVLDRTLIGPRVLQGLKASGWLILNTPQAPESFAKDFPGRHIATVDATAIAVAAGLGTRSVPIVNTTMLGAVARIFGLSIEDVDATLSELEFGGPNAEAAHQAYQLVQGRQLDGEVQELPAPGARGPVASILDETVGAPPLIRTGGWATHRPQRRQLEPPCNHSCPAGNDVQAFVAALAREEFDQALEVLLRTSPLPGVCGRVCPAPCMEACNRRLYDEAVNIRELERTAAQRGRRPEPVQPWREARIAVVGSGPAGLSAAYSLARLGYPVTIIEAGRELGGVMRTGIPEYRLPRDVLDEELSYILRHGVEARTAARIGRAELLRLTDEFAAIFVGTGLQEARALDLGPCSDGVVIEGIDFLERARRQAIRLNGQSVVVVGGGNTAVDAARSALRLGARRVQLLYRRTRAEMPAIHGEIEEALSEGVEFAELVAPLRLSTNGAGALLTCSRMELAEPDESGRRRPVPQASEDACFDVPCDRVILAIGQAQDLSVWPEGAEISAGRSLLGLARAPIFAGGDFLSGEGTVAAAIGSGRRAALHIHCTLSGEDRFPAPADGLASPEHLTLHVFARAPQEKGHSLRPQWRRRRFSEVHLGLVDEPGHHQAEAEARRCLSCGVCNGCDRCVTWCPEGVLVRDEKGYRFDYDYCKGCGVCAAQCPRGVIYMAEM